VIICLGPTATVLAERLAKKGVHALDLGHIGMFMRRLDVDQHITMDDLLSPQYKSTLMLKHEQDRWGASGKSHEPEIRPWAKQLGAQSILDYGCGRGTLKEAMPDYDVREFDPGIPGKDMLPTEPADLLVATDVLEHVESDKLNATFCNFRKLARKGLFLTIATKPAKDILPDGRNAHILLRTPDWWLGQLKGAALVPVRTEQRKSLTVWIKRY
jgi:hypothetical protein